MNKIIKLMMVALVAVAVMTGFASCSKSDDSGSQVPGGSKTYTPMLKMDLKISEDALSVADFTVTYLDENGQEKSEAFTSTTFTKTVNFKSLPAKVKYTVTYKMKSTLPDKDSFDLLISDCSQAGKSDGEGNFSALDLKAYSRETKGVKKEKLEETLERYYGKWSNEGTIEK